MLAILPHYVFSINLAKCFSNHDSLKLACRPNENEKIFFFLLVFQYQQCIRYCYIYKLIFKDCVFCLTSLIVFHLFLTL